MLCSMQKSYHIYLKKKMGSASSQPCDVKKQRLALAHQCLSQSLMPITALCDLVIQYAKGFEGEKLAFFERPRPACAVAWIDENNLAVASNTDVQVWNVSARSVVHELCNFDQCFYLFSSLTVLGARLVAATRDAVFVWDLTTGFIEIVLHYHRVVREVGRLDENRLIVALCLGYLCVFALDTGEHTWFNGSDSDVTEITAIGTDRFATGSVDGMVSVWDMSETEPAHELEGHIDAVVSLCHLGKDKLGSTSRDCTARIWDVVQGVCVVVLAGFDCSPLFLDRFTLALKESDSTMCGYDWDTGVELWEIQTERVVRSPTMCDGKLALCENPAGLGGGRVVVWH